MVSGVIQNFVSFYNSMYDIPDKFLEMIGISMIGAAMGHNFINEILPPVKHNLYMMLVAPSGRYRKSTTISIEKDILNQCGYPKIQEDFGSPEAFIQHLSMKPKCIFLKDEIGSLLSKMSRRNGIFNTMIELFCDIFGEYNKYERPTKTQGIDTVTEPYLNLMFATTLNRFESINNSDLMASGLFPRFIIYFAEESDLKKYMKREYPSQKNVSSITGLRDNYIDLINALISVNHKINLEFIDTNFLNEKILYFENMARNSPYMGPFYSRAGDLMIKIADIYKISDVGPSGLNPLIKVENKFINDAFNLLKMIYSRYQKNFGNMIDWGNKPGITAATLKYIENQETLFLMNKTDCPECDKSSIQVATRADKETLHEVLDNLLERKNIVRIKAQFSKKGKKFFKQIFCTVKFYQDLRDVYNIPIHGISDTFRGPLIEINNKIVTTP